MFACAGDDLTGVRIEQNCFCALRAAVYADEIFAHLPRLSNFVLRDGCRIGRIH